MDKRAICGGATEYQSVDIPTQLDDKTPHGEGRSCRCVHTVRRDILYSGCGKGIRVT